MALFVLLVSFFFPAFFVCSVCVSLLLVGAVPAYFNFVQRNLIINACAKAGFRKCRLMIDAAAAAFAFKAKEKGETNVLVYDLGAGNFSVALLSIEDGVYEVKSVNGDTHLGGDDFDQRMMAHFVQEFKNKHKKDLTTSERALRRLRTACETAKIALSNVTRTTVEIDSLFEGVSCCCAVDI